MSTQYSFLPGVSASKDALRLFKWPGSKGWLASYLVPRFLPLLNAGAVYCEPFAGSLAVFFALRSAGWVGPAVVGDVCAPIIRVYQTLQAGALVPSLLDDVWCHLQLLQAQREGREEAHFFKIRETLNKVLAENIKLDPALFAAFVIYVSRFAFNGLWRCNKQGVINSSFGGESRALGLVQSDLLRASGYLQNTVIALGDYQRTVEFGEGKKLIYADPPYDETEGTYQSSMAGEGQRELAGVLASRILKHGDRVFVSNAETPLIEELYRGWIVEKMPVQYSIAAGEAKKTTEVLLWK